MALVALSIHSAYAATVVYDIPGPLPSSTQTSTISFSTPYSFAGFDPALGTLTGFAVSFSFFGSITVTVALGTCVGTCQTSKLGAQCNFEVTITSDAAGLTIVGGLDSVITSTSPAVTNVQTITAGSPYTNTYTTPTTPLAYSTTTPATLTTLTGAAKTFYVNAFDQGASPTVIGGSANLAYSAGGSVTYGGTVTYTYTAAVTGDPQIVGFQGQHFQIHGTPDEHYNLISTADYYLNSRFEYMATGVCNYNDTECFSHPGTYIGEIALVRGDYHIKVASGPHATGLSVYINDKSAPAGTRVKISNDSSVHVVSANRVILTTEDFTMTAVNSDLFLNLGVDFVNARMLQAGHKHVVIPHSASPSDAEKLIATTYPEFAMHGLLGQTWRNIQWPQHRLYQGEPSDYQVSSLFSPEFLYTQYQA
jgi:hypothetical protein